MTDPLLVGVYDFRYVAVSVIIAVLASYAALDLAGRVTAARGVARRVWLAGGASSMGLGIWSMHYIGMLAFRLPIPVRYDWPTVAASLAAAVVASAVALHVVSRPNLGLASLAIGSVVMGAGIAAMHYIGMDAMRLAAMHHYSPVLVTVSVAVAMIIALVALLLSFRFRHIQRGRVWLKTGVATVMGAAIPVMHYVGMAAVSFTAAPAPAPSDLMHAVSISSLGAIGIMSVTMMVLALAVLSAVADRRFSAQTARLDSAEERYRSLFEHSPIGLYRTTPGGVYLDCNEAYARLLGYPSREALLASTVYDQVAASARDAFIRELVEKKSLSNVESQQTRLDGTTIWVLESARFLQDRDHPSGVIEGTMTDIADRKRAEEALRHATAIAEAARRRVDEAHADLLAVLNTVPAGLVVMDADGSVRLQNNAALHLLGTAPETPEARQAHWRQILIPNAAGQRMSPDDLPAFRALRGVEVIGEEVAIRRPDGEEAELLIGAMPLRNAQGEITGSVSAFQDITRLRELDRLKDEFVAIVSHELRTPLTAIRGSLQLLLADEATPDPGHTELLAVGLKSCERLVRIINDMLDLSKIEAGRLQLNLTLLSVETLISQAAADLEPVAAQAGVHLATAVEPGLPPIKADADRLTQALVNLVSNAIKFSPVGSTVQVAARMTRLGVAIGVADQGRGIAQEDISRLFQKFRQLDQPGTRRTGGTGLGLAITKGIIEEHGGTVVVDSRVGMGSTFTFTLPAGTGPEAHDAQPGARASASNVPVVLVVDNNDATRGERVRAIQAAGFRALESACGEAALAVARREQPDVITVAVAETPGGEQWTIDALGRDPATRTIPVLVAVGADEAARQPGGPLDLTDLVARVGATLEGRTQATILIADDDADTRMVLRTVLERRGYHVVEAADGAEALAAAARTPPDLVLLDLRMPRIHGHDVIRSLRRNAGTLRLPIIVLSGSVGERHSLYSLVLGANAFLTKPADPDTLIREIDRHVHRRAG